MSGGIWCSLDLHVHVNVTEKRDLINSIFDIRTLLLILCIHIHVYAHPSVHSHTCIHIYAHRRVYLHVYMRTRVHTRVNATLEC